MAKRIYFESIKKWLIAAGITGGTLIGGLFLLLLSTGAISDFTFSEDMICAGTIEDPCYAYMNFTANEDIFLYPLGNDPWGRNTTFEFEPNVKSWKLQRSWGNTWRNIPLNKSCTGTWCGLSNANDKRVFSYAFRKGRTYQIRIVAMKNDPTDTIKWSAFDGEIDPTWIGVNTDYVFKELGYSKNGKAEFTLNNYRKELSKNSLDITFNEVCGEVADYKIFVNSTCTKEVPTYYKEYLCHDKDDERFFGLPDLPLCLNETFENGTELVYYDCWKEVKEIPSGKKAYKIDADIKMDICDDGTVGYKIDWIPSIQIDENKFVQEKWAWWNVSYDYRRNITDIPTFKTMYPLNGSVVSDIDGDGTTDLYYGFAGDTVTIYYNDENNTVLVNSSNESIYLVQTLPQINTSGTPPTDLVLWYPMDDSGGKAIDFSGNNEDGILTGVTEGSEGVFGYGYAMDKDTIVTTYDLPSALYTISLWFKKTTTDYDFLLDARADGAGGCVDGVGYYFINHNSPYKLYSSSGSFYVNGEVAVNAIYNEWAFYTVSGITLDTNSDLNIFTACNLLKGARGNVDNFMIHEGTLTQTEIETLYNSSLDTIMMFDDEEEAPVGPAVPEVTKPEFNASKYYINNNIKVNTTYTSAASEVGTVYFRWYVNDTNVLNQTNTTVANGTSINAILTTAYYGASALVNVSVYANNGSVNSTTLWSDKKKIYPIVGWWNSSYLYRHTINISNTAGDLVDYQVRTELNSSNFNYSHANTTGQDLRFINSTNEEIDYWIESWNTSGSSYVWVEVPGLEDGINTTIYMYYGDSSSNAESNGWETFLLFDDFETGAVNSTTWPTTIGTPTESGGQLHTNRATTGLLVYTEAVVSPAISTEKLTMYIEMNGTESHKGFCYSPSGISLYGTGDEQAMMVYLQNAGQDVVADGYDTERRYNVMATADDAWHTYKMTWNGSDAIYSIDDGADIVEAFSFTPSDWKIGIGNNGKDSSVAQNVKIIYAYQHASSEPTYVIEAEEEAPVSDTCTCAGLDTDWEIDMSDHCNITDDCDLGTGTLNFTSTGWMTCNATINTTSMGNLSADQKINVSETCIIYVD